MGGFSLCDAFPYYFFDGEAECRTHTGGLRPFVRGYRRLAVSWRAGGCRHVVDGMRGGLAWSMHLLL